MSAASDRATALSGLVTLVFMCAAAFTAPVGWRFTVFCALAVLLPNDSVRLRRG